MNLTINILYIAPTNSYKNKLKINKNSKVLVPGYTIFNEVVNV